jgi:hypothetical protein
MRRNPANPRAVERVRAANQARRFKKVTARFENGRFATDRFKKNDNVELVIRKNLPSRFHRLKASDHAMIDDPHAVCMHAFEWR